MTFLNVPRNDFHKNHKMALSTMGRCSDARQKLTTENGDRVLSRSSFLLKDFVPLFHIRFIHCVLCGCGECWIVTEERWLEMSFAQPQEGH